MSKTLTKEQCLLLDVNIYNMAMEQQWKTDKVIKNLSGDLNLCKYCGRKYVICCICDIAEKRWVEFIKEVEDVSNRDRSNDF